MGAVGVGAARQRARSRAPSADRCGPWRGPSPPPPASSARRSSRRRGTARRRSATSSGSTPSSSASIAAKPAMTVPTAFQRGVVLRRHRARAAGAAALGDAVAVALHHVDRLQRDAGLVGEELGEHRLVPLPVRLGADIEVHRAVVAELDRGVLLGRAEDRFDVVAQPLPAQLAACRRGGLAGGKAGLRSASVSARVSRRLKSPTS